MTQLILIGLGVILGMILCFNGYKLFRLCLAVAGGILGYAGGTLVCNFIEAQGSTLSLIAKVLITLIPAIILAITAFALYMKALIGVTALFCAYFVYTDYGVLFPGVGASKALLALLAGFVIGLVMGAVVYFAQKWTICFFTAFVGARVIALASANYIWNLFRGNLYALYIQDSLLGTRVTDTPALTACFIIVAFTAAGFVVQLKSSKKK
ncbi:MAG: hypothetical protein J5777_08595 [Clostridiales bacterium]|nr:hypothetical protein [Clostridiales bacterium]